MIRQGRYRIVLLVSEIHSRIFNPAFAGCSFFVWQWQGQQGQDGKDWQGQVARTDLCSRHNFVLGVLCVLVRTFLSRKPGA